MIAIYARQSVDKKDSISIEMQIADCRKKVINHSEIKIYQDKGFSGANTDRPEFQHLMNDISKGRIQKVVVYKLDRISRSLCDFMNIQKRFNEYDVEFISVHEDFDTSTPVGKAMLNILMVFAEFERETIQGRVKEASYERMKQGFFVAGIAPVGFRKVSMKIAGKKTHCLEADPNTEWVIREIYELYAKQDTSIGSIVKKINQNLEYYGFPDAVSNIRISRILRNPVYVKADADVYQYLESKGADIVDDIAEYNGTRGCTLYGKRKNKTVSKFTDLNGAFAKLGWHEGLISGKQWLRVQYKLDNNKQVKNSGKGTHSWLSGIVRCGYCGYAIIIVDGQSTGRKYVNCGGRKDKKGCERKKGIIFDDIEKAVENDLLSHMMQYQYIRESRQKNHEQEVNQYKIELQKVEKAIKNIEEKILMLEADQFAMTIGVFNKKLEELYTQKQAIEQKIIQLRMIDTEEISDDAIEKYLASWKDLNIEEKKIIARLFIHTVYVKNDEICINYRINLNNQTQKDNN
ncbi:MAG: recombinase family protein [Ruminococcus sp.]|nr:recombinase family protein [Ruminococcus sp.]